MCLEREFAVDYFESDEESNENSKIYICQVMWITNETTVNKIFDNSGSGKKMLEEVNEAARRVLILIHRYRLQI